MSIYNVDRLWRPIVQRLENAIDWVIARVFCEHDWVFEKKIREQNLRSGYRHDSHIFRCSYCGAHKTVELPPDHT